jgi:hypothetical protein
MRCAITRFKVIFSRVERIGLLHCQESLGINVSLPTPRFMLAQCF